jgi:hypothetical protein
VPGVTSLRFCVQLTTHKLLYLETQVRAERKPRNCVGYRAQMQRGRLTHARTCLSQDVVETTIALENFRRACDCGRGSVFFSVARGKVSARADRASPGLMGVSATVG